MNNSKSTSKLDFKFAQRVVNVSFLVMVMAFFASSVSAPSASSTTDIDGIQTTDGIDGETNTCTASPLLGQLAIFPYNFAPRGWAACEGQLLAINSNQSLFSLLGTTYGGDGRTTFGLPDLRGRTVIGSGTGAGLASRTRGAKFGAESVILSVANMPAHTHAVTVNASDEDGEETDPTGQYLGAAQDDLYMGSSNTTMAADAVIAGTAGGSTSITNMPPVQVLGYYIALQGVFPSRN